MGGGSLSRVTSTVISSAGHEGPSWTAVSIPYCLRSIAAPPPGTRTNMAYTTGSGTGAGGGGGGGATGSWCILGGDLD